MKCKFRKIVILLFTIAFSSLGLFASMEEHEGLKPLTLLEMDKFPILRNGIKILPLQVRNNLSFSRSNSIIKGGIPFKKGELFSENKVVLKNENGETVFAQFKVLSRWWDFNNEDKNASIKWLRVVFKASIKANSTQRYYLHLNQNNEEKFEDMVYESKGKLIVNTGAMKVQFEKGKRVGLKQITLQGKQKQQILKKPVYVFSNIDYKVPAPHFRWVVLKDLNERKNWRFKTDPNEKGEKNGWQDLLFDDKKWKHLDPKVAWENQGYEYYDRVAWFRSKFKLKNNLKKRKLFLELKYLSYFKNQKLTIYLNGKRLDTLENGIWKKEGRKKSLEKRIRLHKNRIKFGKDNSIAIRVDGSGAGLSGLRCIPRIISQHDEELDGRWEDLSGKYSSLNGSKTRLEIVENGPHMVVIRQSGSLGNSKKHQISNYDLYFSFYRGSGKIDMSLTYTQMENPSSYFYNGIGVSFPVKLKGGSTLLVSKGLKDRQPFRLENYNGKRVNIHQFHDGGGRYPGFPTLLDHPFIPKFTINKKGEELYNGQKTLGALTWIGQDFKASLFNRNFWESYPSECSISKTSIKFYMWPESQKPMDMRNWYRRKGAGLDQMIKVVGRDFTNDSGVDKHFLNSPNYLPIYNSVGCRWTREFRLELDTNTSTDDESQISKASDYEQAILPFVSPEYNCGTEALGIPVHPRDVTNYPILEKYTDVRLEWNSWLQWEHLKIYGMWHWGALRYGEFDKERIYREYKRRKKFLKYAWDRRWFNQERGISPSMSYWTQYFRTGDTKHLRSGKTISRFASRALIRTSHANPAQRLGYALVHRKQIWSYEKPSHTNIQGIVTDYLMTGDEWTGQFLRDLEKIYSKERMVNYGDRTGEYTFHRANQTAITCRAILWYVNGSDKMKNWVLHGLNYLKKMEEKGFTCYRPSYHLDQLTKTWYYTRSPLALDNLAKPISLFVDGSFKGLYNEKAFKLQKHFTEFPWLNDPLTWKEQLEKLKKKPPYLHVPDFNVGLIQAALYRAKFPVNGDRFYNKSIYKRYWPSLNSALPLTKGFQYRPLKISPIANADPFELIPKKVRMVEGEYCINKGTLPDYQAELESNEIAWDFGLLDHHQKSWKRAYGMSKYPTIQGYEHAENLSGLPWGTSFSVKNIPIRLLDPVTNGGRGIYKSFKGETVELAIDDTVSQIAFIGHIQQNELDMTVKVGMEYELQYEDGSKKVISIKPGVHYDDWRQDRSATNVLSSSRVRSYIHHPGDRYALHFNIFVVKADQKKNLSKILIRSFIDGFILMGISTESPVYQKEEKPIVIYQNEKDSEKILPFNDYNFPLENGWYDITMRLQQKQRPAIEPISIIVGDEIVTSGFVYNLVWRVPELTFPVKIENGNFNFMIIRNDVLDDSCLKWVHAKKRDNVPEWKNNRKKFDINDVYGLRYANLHEHNDSLLDYPARDNVTCDWVNISNNSFMTHVDNGRYKLEALLFSTRGIKDYIVKINDADAKSIDLPPQQASYPQPFEHKPFETLIHEVDVNDQSLRIEFPKTRSRSIGIRALRLTKITSN